MIYSIDQVRHLHLEISSLCNAACPLCPRNVNGYPYNSGYREHNMTLAEAQTVFPITFIKQLKNIIINGNFGDAVMNPETTDIIRYFKQHNSELHINISTNGGARSAKFWEELAEIETEVVFCIDGLDNATHALYRRNTLYDTVIKNAKTFISAGGRALWKMIHFEHNESQLVRAKQLSQELGFLAFLLVDDGRDSGPVYDRNGNLEYVIGPGKIDYQLPARVESMLDGHLNLKYRKNQLYQIKKIPVEDPIHCEVKYSRSLYVSSTADVFPCCYTGLNPQEYKNNSAIGYGLEQIAQIMTKNNALEYSLKECIEWFDQIEKTWSISEFEQGRSLICTTTCGGPNKRAQYHVKQAEYTENSI